MNIGLNNRNSLKLNQSISAGPVSMAVDCELQFQWNSVIMKVEARRLKVKMNGCYLMLPMLKVNMMFFCPQEKGCNIQETCVA